MMILWVKNTSQEFSSNDMHQTRTGDIETYYEEFHWYHKYLKLFDIKIHSHFNADVCGWAYFIWKKA